MWPSLWQVVLWWLREVAPHEFHNGGDDWCDNGNVHLRVVFKEKLKAVLVFANLAVVMKDACLILRSVELDAEARSEEALPKAQVIGGGPVFGSVTHEGNKKFL